MIRTAITFALLAAFAAAQTPPEQQRFYARAYYTKWKPGKATEGQTFIKDVAAKAALNWLQKEPKAVGQVTMTRVLPGGVAIGHDRLRLAIYAGPPNLDTTDTPGAPAFVAPVMPHADYVAKLQSLLDNVRSEIWQSVLRLGSLRQGDYVRVTWSKNSGGPGDVQDRLNYYRTWVGPMWNEVMKSGITRGHESWQIRNPGAEPSWVNIIVSPDSDSTYKGFPDQQATFHKAHPGKDYHTYREIGAALAKTSTTTQTITYRVDLAQWK